MRNVSARLFPLSLLYIRLMTARLLWVDDEIEMLKAHILFLQKKGYEVATASNGPDAIDMVAAAPYDLILLDENMPGLSGLETLSRLKDVAPTVPVVMVTKNEEEDIMNQAIGSKIADYLIKPVNPNQILLALKKNLHQRDLVQEVAQSGYRQDFARIGMQISDRLAPEEWKELYKRLVHWEMELSAAAPDGAMSELLRSQKEEANAAFAKFVARNYADWAASPESRPLMSPDVVRRCVLPRLKEGRRVFLLVLDNFRFDQWRALAPTLADDFDIDEDLCFSILPTATQYARNALFAGLMPLQIKQNYPQLWVEEDDEESKNRHEEELLRLQMARFRCKESVAYCKINDSSQARHALTQLMAGGAQLNVLVVNFIDILSHARTESRMVRELAGTESAYRSITLSWFRNSPVKELFDRLATEGQDCDVIITTDHGSLRVADPVRVVGDRNVNTNLRYKLGRNLTYNPREVVELTRPADWQLPSPNLTTAYIFATASRFFAYPNNYNHYVQHYRGTFQHGGISMEEMLVPLATLRAKRSR